MNLYFPTINHWPARFDVDQICYCGPRFPVKPEKSLKVIKKQIEKSILFRVKEGFECNQSDYGHQRILLNKEEL